MRTEVLGIDPIHHCPICKEHVRDLQKHLRKIHTKSEVERSIFEDKKSGLSDVEIGRKYGITYKQLEGIIRKFTGVSVSNFHKKKKLKRFHPKNFEEESTSVWSFKQRGDWATHSGAYRGNWSPYIPRNVILKYSKPGELVLDYFCGAGTTAVEAKLLGRRCIASDINDKAIEMARENLDFEINGLFSEVYEPELYVADARDLSFIEDETVDLICAHPPYADIIHYTDHKEGDLSFLGIDEFLREMEKVARESYRVLRPGRQCAILIGDMRKNRYVVPLGFKLINVYLNAGFKLRELVIKRQHNCKTTGFWYKRSIEYNFLLLAHEYLPIFEKPVREQPKIQEDMIEYGALTCLKDRAPKKRKLEQQETTTVWVLPEKEFEKVLNKNVMERYGSKGSLTVSVSFFQPQKNRLPDFKAGRYGLIFIKSPCLKDNMSPKRLKEYIENVNFIVSQYANKKGKGYVVIQTKDVRTGKYLEPMAKRIVDKLESANKIIKLKEIIVITTGTNEKEISDSSSNREHSLKITHQYLLVYEVGGISEP